MTTPTQVAVNSAAVLAAAARLEARGWQGSDAAAFVEGLLLEAIRSGYKPVEPVPALRGPGARREVIDECKQATAVAVREARMKRECSRIATTSPLSTVEGTAGIPGTPEQHRATQGVALDATPDHGKA